MKNIVIRVWLRGQNREIGFCGTKWCCFSDVVEVREWLADLMKTDQVLEFVGCGYHMVREDINGRKHYWWSVCKWLE